MIRCFSSYFLDGFKKKWLSIDTIQLVMELISDWKSIQILFFVGDQENKAECEK